MPAPDLPVDLDEFVAGHEQELIEFRRDLHAHPEIAHAERRTTAKVAQRLMAAGLRPRIMSSGTGLWADVGTGSGPLVALRADLDALAIPDEKHVPYRSTVPNVSHACGHDVHTAVLVGAGLFLAGRRGPGAAARPGEAAVPARRGSGRGRADGDGRGRHHRRRPDLRPALRPPVRDRPDRAADRPDHRRLRQDQGEGQRAGRAHRAAASDR